MVWRVKWFGGAHTYRGHVTGRGAYCSPCAPIKYAPLTGGGPHVLRGALGCTHLAISSLGSRVILLISWLVRKPSKKWTKGTLERREARWATSAMSWASCTLWLHSMPHPVCGRWRGNGK